MNAELNRHLDYLANDPTRRHTTMTRKNAKMILLETGGQILAAGKLYDVIVRNIGAGVCRISLSLTQLDHGS